MQIGKAYYVFGIRRSGNHLISNWMCDISGEGCGHIQNASVDFFSFLCDYPPEYDNMDVFVVGIEEHPVNAFSTAYCLEAEESQTVVILRDPYNLFASRVKHYKIFDAPYVNEDFVKFNWVDYAQAYLEGRSDVTFILYNKFVRDVEYRKDIAHQLGIKFSPAYDKHSMDKVRKGISKGSSFENRDTGGSEMKIEERWKVYENDDRFKALFTDEIRELSQKIFGFAPL